MLELELTKAAGTLDSVKLRKEKVGAEKLRAVDIRITFQLTHDILAFFGPDLGARLFHFENDLAGPRAFVRDPNRVYPEERDEEMYGATGEIEYGLDKIVLADVKVNKLRLTPMDGGALLLGARLQFRTNDGDVDKLHEMLEGQVTVTVEPCELKEMQQAA